MLFINVSAPRILYLQGRLYLATRKFPYCIKDSVHIVKNNIFCFVQDEQRKLII